MSLGQGAQNLILARLTGLARQQSQSFQGKFQMVPSSAAQTLSDSLKNSDLTALEIKANVPYAKEVMPMVLGGGNAIYGNQVYQVSIYGGGTLMASIMNITVGEGNFFSDDDVLSKSQVVVIGYKVKDHLFDGDEAIGQKIRIGNNTFKVIGVLPQKGASGLINFDDAIIMPYTTAQTYVLGINYFNRIIVEADTQDHIDATAADITDTLRNDHNITDPTQDDFSVETSADIASTLEHSDKRSDGVSRGGSGDIPYCRRNRHYEYHACFGDGADTRNRPAKSAWRLRSRHSDPILT